MVLLLYGGIGIIEMLVTWQYEVTMIQIRKWMIAGASFVSLLMVGMALVPAPSIDW
jgi:hypothetical protein